MMEPADPAAIRPGRLTLGVLLAAMVVIGVYPAPLMDTVRHAAAAIFPAADAGRAVGGR